MTSDKRPEEWVKTQVKKILKEYKQSGQVYYFMPAASQFGRAGAHDFILSVAGRFVSIETKGTGGRVSELQKAFAERMQAAGGICLLVSEKNFQEVSLIVQRLILNPMLNYKGHNFD